MANVTLGTTKKDDEIEFEFGEYYEDTTNGCVFLAVNIDDEGGEALVSTESGFRYSDDDEMPFGDEPEDFRKLLPGETITIEVD